MSNTAKNCRYWLSASAEYCEKPVKYHMEPDGGEPGAALVRVYDMFCPEHKEQAEQLDREDDWNDDDGEPLIGSIESSSGEHLSLVANSNWPGDEDRDSWPGEPPVNMPDHSYILAVYDGGYIGWSYTPIATENEAKEIAKAIIDGSDGEINYWDVLVFKMELI
jgi:hypothetical protein